MVLLLLEVMKLFLDMDKIDNYFPLSYGRGDKVGGLTKNQLSNLTTDFRGSKGVDLEGSIGKPAHMPNELLDE